MHGAGPGGDAAPALPHSFPSVRSVFAPFGKGLACRGSRSRASQGADLVGDRRSLRRHQNFGTASSHIRPVWRRAGGLPPLSLLPSPCNAPSSPVPPYLYGADASTLESRLPPHDRHHGRWTAGDRHHLPGRNAADVAIRCVYPRSGAFSMLTMSQGSTSPLRTSAPVCFT